ncbi:MAG: hypothetical protein R3C05_24665 [Pirellulaceae bacterium]
MASFILGSTLWGGYFGLCWLGVMVFSGDGAPDRLRFLADRGVSPTRVWLSRHLFGLSLVAFFSLVVAVTNVIFFRLGASPDIPVISLATIFILALSLYSISQWTAQTLQMLSVSSVASPVFSAAMIYWLIATTYGLAVPYWLGVCLIVLPMIATWVSMPQYMDGHRGWYRWSIACAALLLIIVLPIIPVALLRYSLPRLDKATEAAWTSEAVAILGRSGPAEHLRFLDTIYVDVDGNIIDDPFISIKPNLDGNEDESETDEAMNMGGMATRKLKANVFKKHVLADFEADDDDVVPVTIDDHDLKQAYGQANIAKLAVKNNPEDADAVADLGEWIETWSIAAHRLRRHPSLRASLNADIMEIWLTRTLQMRELKPYLTQPWAQAAIERLRDKDFRTTNRRRAVLAEWYRATQTDPTQTTQTTLSRRESQEQGQSEFVQMLLSRRRDDAQAMALIELIEAGGAGQSTEPMRRRLHELAFGDILAFENGPYSDRFRADGGEQSIAFAPDGVLTNYVGSQWYAGWENVWSKK